MTRAQELNITEFPYVELNEQGGIIYTEDSDGFWIRVSWHPVHNKVTKTENSRGETHTFDFNDAGQLTRFSTGRYWKEFQYDSEGNKVGESSSIFDRNKLDNRTK